jgi:hypothetical protein
MGTNSEVRGARGNLAQRVILVIGSGAALYIVGLWLTSLGTHFATGWVAYAPLSDSSFGPSLGGLHPWVRLVIWLLLIFVWTGLSLAVLSGNSTKPQEKGSDS